MIFIDNKTTSLLNSADVDSRNHNLELLSETTGIIFNNIKDTVNLLRMNNDFIEYEYFSDKLYFKNFHKQYNEDRISEYSRFLKLRAEINHNLEQFATTSEYIQSVYYYDPDVKEVFSVEFIPSDIQQFKDKEWFRDLPNMDSPSFSGPHTDRNNTQVIYMVFPSQLNSKSVFVVNINMDAFYRYLWEKIQPRNTKEFFILNSESIPFVYVKKNLRLINTVAWALINKDKKEDLSKITLDEETHYISSLYNLYFGLSFHSINDQKSITQLFKQNRIYLLLFIAPIMLLTLVLIFILRKLLYSPINRLITHVSDNNVDNVANLDTWIGNSITDRESKMRLLEKAIPAYQINFMRKMLDQYEEKDDIETVESEFKLLNFPFYPKNLRVISCFPEFIDSMDIIHRSFCSWTESYAHGAICVKEHIAIYTVVDCMDLDYLELCSAVDTFIKFIYETESIKVYGAVSKDFWPIESIHKGVLQIESDNKNYIKYPYGTSMAELSRVPKESSKKLRLIDGLLDDIIISLKENNNKNIKNLFNKQFTSLDNSCLNSSPDDVLSFYVYWIRSLISRLKEQGYTMGSNSKEIDEFFVTLYRVKTRESIHELIFNFIKEVGDSIISNHDVDKTQDYVQIAKKIIDNRLGQDISLSSVAEEMGISSFYLSRLFKNVCNDSFSSYLKNKRMVLAKELLEDHSMQVQDISKKIGYWSSNYFIKVFKKYYGITPGEYRHISLSQNK
ncbi:MAG: AraC family transcriptional regulator [Spirochaetaceae bacterium]